MLALEEVVGDLLLPVRHRGEQPSKTPQATGTPLLTPTLNRGGRVDLGEGTVEKAGQHLPQAIGLFQAGEYSNPLQVVDFLTIICYNDK